MSLSFPRFAQFSWGGSPEPRRAPSPGCWCSQQDPVKPTRASAAGQGSRPTKLSDIAHECVRYQLYTSIMADSPLTRRDAGKLALAGLATVSSATETSDICLLSAVEMARRIRAKQLSARDAVA